MTFISTAAFEAAANKTRANVLRAAELNSRALFAATARESELCTALFSSPDGLPEQNVEEARERFGANIVTKGKRDPLAKRLFKAFINPFTAILLVLAVVSAFTDIWLAEPGDADPTTVVIITAMVLISGLLRFVQETRSGNAAENLLKLITTTTCVLRPGEEPLEINLESVVVGDVVRLAAGDMIPADLRILKAKDLFVSQSTLTGESAAVEKTPRADASSAFEHANGTLEENADSLSEARFAVAAFADDASTKDTTSSRVGNAKLDALTDSPVLAFMGTTVISGSATGIVYATGDDTALGSIAKTLEAKPVKTGFEKGVNSVSWLLIRFMLVMVPIVLFANGFTKGDWTDAALFAISVAVGLTPEMLPMIVTTSLAKGATAMAKKKTVIKNLNSIQNLGSIDVLCTDKTGTLTQDNVVLEYHLNIHGNEDARVLRHAFLNSYFQTGLKNLMDRAILDTTAEEAAGNASLQGLAERYRKVDEVPFDFDRRRMSVVVADAEGKTQMITKGAVEEMLAASSFAEYEGVIAPLTPEVEAFIRNQVDELGENGLRVIAVAQKTNPRPVGAFGADDECDMVLIGYLAFLDPPKETAGRAIEALANHGVSAKVLTGDSDKVARSVCRQVGIPAETVLLGSDVDNLNDAELAAEAERTSVFAKLSPVQKARIVSVLRGAGHSVGYLGDGINDAAAMKASDVGISVDTAVDIAKESADVILLEKDLMVLEGGIEEGRKTYANMIKYIKMTASSNFGNMFSVLAASAFLPFMPMMSIQLLLLNLIYDLSCTAIPWDNVDKEYLVAPKKWDASGIGRFMVRMGPTSSVFDIATFLAMYFVICPAMCGGLLFNEIADPAMQLHYIALFQAGWFIESMWTQTLVIHMIRTPKIPFVQSRSSLPVILLTLAGIAALTVIPFTKFGASLGLAALPPAYFGLLIVIVVAYMMLVTLAKRAFVKKYGELL